MWDELKDFDIKWQYNNGRWRFQCRSIRFCIALTLSFLQFWKLWEVKMMHTLRSLFLLHPKYSFALFEFQNWMISWTAYYSYHESSLYHLQLQWFLAVMRHVGCTSFWRGSYYHESTLYVPSSAATVFSIHARCTKKVKIYSILVKFYNFIRTLL